MHQIYLGHGLHLNDIAKNKVINEGRVQQTLENKHVNTRDNTSPRNRSISHPPHISKLGGENSLIVSIADSTLVGT